MACAVRAGAAGHDRRQRPPAAAARRPRCELCEGSPHERRDPRTDGEFCYPSCRIESVTHHPGCTWQAHLVRGNLTTYGHPEALVLCAPPRSSGAGASPFFTSCRVQKGATASRFKPSAETGRSDANVGY